MSLPLVERGLVMAADRRLFYLIGFEPAVFVLVRICVDLVEWLG